MASTHKRISDLTGAATWQVKYRTPEGEPRSKTFKLKRDADKFARGVETSKDVGEFVDPRLANITMGEWATRWLTGKANLAESTRERNADIIAAHIVPRWGRTRLSAVRHEDVQDWLTELDRAPATVRKVHRVTSQVLEYAVKTKRLTRNPAKGVSLPRVEAGEHRYLTHVQVDALADAVGPDWSLLALFLAYTGLRWGEVAALRVSRLDLDARRASIAESVTPVRGVMTFGEPKTHERRKVPIPRFLVDDLGRRIHRKDAGDLVFLGPRGGVLRAQTFQRAALDAAAEQLGLCEVKLDDTGVPITRTIGGQTRPVFTAHFHPHEFRHTAASLAIASGADVKVVQTMLGHKSATMTLDQYGHLFPDRLDVVAKAMARDRRAALKAAAKGVAREQFGNASFETGQPSQRGQHDDLHLTTP